MQSQARISYALKARNVKVLFPAIYSKIYFTDMDTK